MNTNKHKAKGARPSSERSPTRRLSAAPESRPSRADRAEASAPAAPTRSAPGVADSARSRRQGGGLWLYGTHAVAAALTNPERPCQRLLGTEAGLASVAGPLAKAIKAGFTRPAPERTERLALDQLLPSGSVHQGVALEVGPLPEVDLSDVIAAAGPQTLLVILDQVTDPHNVGAILRSASAFGAAAVVLTERHAPEATPVLAKSASGAMESVPMVRVTNLARALSELREAGFWCVGLAERGTRALHELDLSGRTALVLGAEGEGLRRLTMERCDELAHLPTGGPVASLNVSNAAAVALYEVARRR